MRFLLLIRGAAAEEAGGTWELGAVVDGDVDPCAGPGEVEAAGEVPEEF